MGVQMKVKNAFTDFATEYKRESANDLYCGYCIRLKTMNVRCCGDEHFVAFRQFDDATQANIIEEEYRIAFGVAA
jgi:hypothetical protein